MMSDLYLSPLLSSLLYLEIEFHRHLEIELDRATPVGPLQRIYNIHIDLRSIKCPLSLDKEM